jgi:dihydrofolate reductase/thymidylate synthase
MLNIILCVDKNYGIGYKNKLPWKINEETEIFHKKTMNNILIVGSKTYSNLPVLKNRIIYVISHNNEKKYPNTYNNVEDAINKARKSDKDIYIIGGNQIFQYVILNYIGKIRIHISILKEKYDCDCFFEKDLLDDYYIVEKEDHKEFTHYIMENINFGERQYLNLLKEIISFGNKRDTRNSVTISDFGKNLKFDMREGFPLLTTKKMFVKAIIEELLFFIRGNTDTKILEELNINIWKENTNRKFLDANNFKERKEGILGPLYGYQWRNFGARYDEFTGQPLEKGIDQLQEVIDLINNDPHSRRILLTSYNPSQAKNGVLYPCHSITIQFYVKNDFLDMFCYNRSSDCFHGLPFNIASSSLLLLIIAQITNLTPRYLHLTLGDAHIYNIHQEAVLTQIERHPYCFPQIKLPNFKTLSEVEKLSHIDFCILNYKYYDSIKAPMVA